MCNWVKIKKVKDTVLFVENEHLSDLLAIYNEFLCLFKRNVTE